MKVRLLATIVDLDDKAARHLINLGAAVPCDEVRAAVALPPRNAARRTEKPNPRKAVTDVV